MSVSKGCRIHNGHGKRTRVSRNTKNTNEGLLKWLQEAEIRVQGVNGKVYGCPTSREGLSEEDLWVAGREGD